VMASCPLTRSTQARTSRSSTSFIPGRLVEPFLLSGRSCSSLGAGGGKGNLGSAGALPTCT
jgi:hypothetical protein